MKKLISSFIILLMSCSSSKRSDWDSGAAARGSYEQQRMEEQAEQVQNQFPTVTPGTERNQPF
jgi:hypothetical protein